MHINPMARTLITIAAASLLAACASVETRVNASNENPDVREVGNPRFAAIRQATNDKERDRLAILAMQGEYDIDFSFFETVRLKAGYEYKDRKDTGGHETVFVIEETPDFISLQHILVVGDGYVVKHWRQDWTYRAKNRFEFTADQTWTVKPVPTDAGEWTQCVFEVSDAPRYCGTGDWRHQYGVSTWTSDRTWRPLPRREYTVRNDYHTLNVENRHTITPFGWSHEQDNTKVVRDGARTVETLVREFGFNDYRNVEGIDFSPAYAYWQDTADYWAHVRARWTERLSTPGDQLVLLTGISGMEVIGATFAHADRLVRDAKNPASVAELIPELDQVFDEYVTDDPTRLAQLAQETGSDEDY